MKKLPLGIQTFKDVIKGNYVYADKTQYIYSLINDAKYYFLSRPRRFGKSLLLDTIAEVLKGDRELFKGLWIYDSDYSFIKHPVIRIDMSALANKTPDILEKSLSFYLKICYDAEGFVYEENIAANAFMNLIILLRNKYGQRVAVLIDEYDKPILDHIEDIETANGNKQVLRNFYGILKSMDSHLRFTMITGVTKFSKTSIFSGLNNLFDITLSRKYANICGIVTSDLDKYFSEHIKYLSTLDNFKQFENLRDGILSWYDGYSWDGETKVINPFSLITFIMQERFEGFWFESGSPKFLIDLIKKNPGNYANLKNLEINEFMLDKMSIENIVIESLLFQAGYLTVKEIKPSWGELTYLVEMPNREVREAFNLHIISALTETGDVRTWHAYRDMRNSLQAGDLQIMLDKLRGLFASIPYELHVDAEAYYHSIFYAVMILLGFDMSVEISTSRGRIDATLELGDIVYVMDFKYEKCPPDASDDTKKKLFDTALEKAINQIKDRGYADKYIGSGKAIYKAAFVFLGRDEIELRVEN